MVLFMEVTKDEYELPLAVAYSVRELAELRGMKENTIRNAMHRARINGRKCRFIKVEVEDD